jgi:hypothetical protein
MRATRSLPLSDPALQFMKRACIDQTLAPASMTATLYNLIVALGETVVPAAPDTDFGQIIEELVGHTLHGMSEHDILSELHSVLTQKDVRFSSAPTNQGHEGSWSVRDRVAEVLGDVYRELLNRLVAAYHEPQESQA